MYYVMLMSDKILLYLRILLFFIRKACDLCSKSSDVNFWFLHQTIWRNIHVFLINTLRVFFLNIDIRFFYTAMFWALWINHNKHHCSISGFRHWGKVFDKSNTRENHHKEHRGTLDSALHGGSKLFLKLGPIC